MRDRRAQALPAALLHAAEGQLTQRGSDTHRARLQELQARILQALSNRVLQYLTILRVDVWITKAWRKLLLPSLWQCALPCTRSDTHHSTK
jgi:hypothetical protein